MKRFIICILFLVLLAINGCVASANLPQDSARQTVAPAAAAPTVISINPAPLQTQPSAKLAAVMTPARTPVPTVAPTLAPNPLNVQVKTDTRISASAVISTTGGTLSVQDNEGTRFTLTFPQGALFQDTQVTLAPLTRVEGLPFSGGLVGGVQMSPEGLRLLRPATLTIESPKTVAAQGYETVAFAYHENGQGMYLNPSEAKGQIMTLEVWHFSGAGAAQGTAAEIQTQHQQHVPANPEDAFIQRVTEYVAREHDAQVRGEQGDPDVAKRMSEFFREYYDRFVGPQLPVALQDCKAAPAILSKALGWLRQLYLLGMEESFSSEDDLIGETLTQATINCYNKEYEQCLLDHDIKHRTAMLGHLRQAALLGFQDRLDESKILKCKPSFHVDETIAEGRGQLTGDICAMDEPFALQLFGKNAGGGQYEGYLEFAPTSETAGSWKHKATTTCLPTLGCGTVDASGVYHIKGTDDSKWVIIIDQTTQTTNIAGRVSTVDMPGWQFEIKPGAQGCGAK